MSCADDFLAATNPIFEECQSGVSILSRTIVATPASMVGQVRTALVPALYAYWERFFRLTFSEFLRCISLAEISLDKISGPLAKYRVRKEFLPLRKSHRDHLINLADESGVAEARKFLLEAVAGFGQIDQVWQQPVAFAKPDEWIDPESNVRYEVVERACQDLGIDPEKLKAMLKESGIQLYPALKDLVDTRNSIAHGSSITSTSSERWNKLQEFVMLLMNAVQLFLYNALVDGKHLAP